LRSGGILIVLQLILALQTRLNFVDDAEVADEFGAACIDEMRLAVGALINLGGSEIGDARLLPRKAGEGSESQKHCTERNAAIGEALGIHAAEPCADSGPSGDGFARAEGFIENVVNKTRRRIDLRKRMQSGKGVGDAGDKRSAARARVHMRIKFVLLGGGEKAVEVVGQEQLGLFTVPVHKAPSETSKLTFGGRFKKFKLDRQRIRMVAPPFAAGCEPIRCGPG